MLATHEGFVIFLITKHPLSLDEMKMKQQNVKKNLRNRLYLTFNENLVLYCYWDVTRYIKIFEEFSGSL